MRKKKIGIALVILLVMAAVLSIRAHAADSPQTVIDVDGSGTTISVTDITPREDKHISGTIIFPCAALYVYIKFLWGDSIVVNSDISGVDYGRRERFRENYEGDEEDFYQKMLEFCNCATERAAEFTQFQTLEYSDSIFEAVRKSPDFLTSIIGPWQMGFWNLWHCAMYFYFRGQPSVGDELMQKFIEWRFWRPLGGFPSMKKGRRLYRRPEAQVV